LQKLDIHQMFLMETTFRFWLCGEHKFYSVFLQESW